MRGGLWQKQRRPSACLLCSYSYSYNFRHSLRSGASARTYSALVSNGLTEPTTLSISRRPTTSSQVRLSNNTRNNGFMPAWAKVPPPKLEPRAPKPPPRQWQPSPARDQKSERSSTPFQFSRHKNYNPADKPFFNPSDRPTFNPSDRPTFNPPPSSQSTPSNPFPEWANLTRRRSNNDTGTVKGFDFSRPARSMPFDKPVPPPSSEYQQTHRRRLTASQLGGGEQSPAQQPHSNSPSDEWAKLVAANKEESRQPKKIMPTAEDKAAWAWADETGQRPQVRRVESQEQGEGGRYVHPEDRVAASLRGTWGMQAAGTVVQVVGEEGETVGRREGGRGREREVVVEKSKRSKGGRRRNDDEDEEFDVDYAEERRRRKAERKAEKERQRLAELDGPTPILLPEFISVSNLASALGVKARDFVRQLEELGFEEVSQESILTGETAALVAQEYGFEPTVETGETEDLRPRPPPEDPSSLPLRPPVVTIMGHVDHGKTTLLDYLRKSSIVSQEHGGITQHIGAFSVKMSSGKQITFLDTPGHAAFLSMRQRGATVTDMVILVVAADDSVKPQTIEAIKHARGANVPIIVAINKMDKPEANPDRVKADLGAQGVELEDFGGDVQVVEVSGKTGLGMDDLEENILLLAEMLDIRAEQDGMAEGWVLESSIKPIGRVATVLVKRGTLRPGDFIVAGRVSTKIRLLRNEAGVEIPEAPPGTAVEILGWREPPAAGDQVLQAPDEDTAKVAVRYRQEQKEREEAIEQMAEMEKERKEKEAAERAANGEEIPEDDEATGTKYLTYLIKGDVHGSVEAVTASILEQGNNEVRPRILKSSTGQINESDVEHAQVSGGAIINFNNPIAGHIKAMADAAGVPILDHNVIYHLVEDVRGRLSELLAPTVSFRVLAEAEVLKVFAINTKGRRYHNVAGCRVRNGVVNTGGRCKVLRGEEVVYEGTIDELKHGKKEVTEIKKGGECGIMFEGWDEFQEGDRIQMVEEIREKRKL